MAKRTSEDPGESPGLEVIEQSDPIRVWRGLEISAENNNVALASINNSFGGFLAVEHKAVCNAQNQSMWFGAMTMTSILGFGPPSPEPKKIPAHDLAPHEECSCGFYGVKDRKDVMGNTFVAEAEFYGKVIEHEKGYRAEYQRVLSVRVRRPELCLGSFLCEGHPETIWFPKSGKALVACGECAATRKRVATLSKLAGRLGVEVRWDG